MVSLFTAGACIGAGIAGPVGDFVGRRRTISLGCLVFCLGGGLQTGAQNIGYLYSGRALAGFGYVVSDLEKPQRKCQTLTPSLVLDSSL